MALGIVLMSVIILVSPKQVQHEVNVHASQSQPDTTANEQINLKIFLRKTAADPVATFTGVLAILTLCLFFVSAFQGYMLIRSDKTARISAEAAQRAAENIPIVERAFIYADLALPNLAAPSAALQEMMRTKATNPVTVDIDLSVFNFGKTPAVITSAIAFDDMGEPQEINETIYPAEMVFDEKTVAIVAAGAGKYIMKIKTPVISAGFGLYTRTVIVYCWGLIKYRDIFNTEHSTEFCMALRDSDMGLFWTTYGPPHRNQST